jgi:hypothetical protein
MLQNFTSPLASRHARLQDLSKHDMYQLIWYTSNSSLIDVGAIGVSGQMITRKMAPRRLPSILKDDPSSCGRRGNFTGCGGLNLRRFNGL